MSSSTLNPLAPAFIFSSLDPLAPDFTPNNFNSSFATQNSTITNFTTSTPLQSNCIFNKLVIASVNANKSFVSNMSFYLDFLNKYNVHICMIQEAGNLPNSLCSSNSFDSNTTYPLFANNYLSLSVRAKDPSLSLLTLVRNDIVPFASVSSNSSNFQHLKLLSPYNIELFNVYIDHNQNSARFKTEHITNMINSPSIKNKRIIICGDLNSYLDSNVDYFTTGNRRPSTKFNAIKYFISKSSGRIVDTWRMFHPSSQRYTKYTCTFSRTRRRVTATRIDHILTSKNLSNKIENIEINESNSLSSDHLPLILTLTDNVPSEIPCQSSPHLKLKHYTKWNPSDFTVVKSFCDNFENFSFNSTEDIEWINSSLVAHVLDALKLQQVPTNQNKPSNKPFSKLQPVRKLTLKIIAALKRGIIQQTYIFPSHLIDNLLGNLLHHRVQHFKQLICNTDSVYSLLDTMNHLNRLLTSLIKKKINKFKKNDINRKIDKILNDPDFDKSKVYTLIKSRNFNNKISYVIDSSCPNDPKILFDKESVLNKVKEQKQKFFHLKTQPKDLSKFLTSVPRLTNKISCQFTPSDVRYVLTNRTNTTPGTDKIPFAFFKFCNKEIPSLFYLITSLYNACIQFNFVPPSWLEGVTSSIPKPESSQSLENWRPITLLNTLYKGFTLIINKSIISPLIDSNIIPAEQKGFCPKRGTANALLLYSELIQMCNSNSLPLHALYIDIKKAFDSVQHWVIQNILEHIGVDKNLLNTLKFVMDNSFTRFITEHGLSDKVFFKRGVKQGDPLSPTLFIIYMLPFQHYINSLNLSVTNLFNLCHMCYADDLLLLANSKNNMNTLYKALIEYTDLTDIEIHPMKSALSILNDTKYTLTYKNFNVPILPSSKTYKYLGVEIALSLDVCKIQKNKINSFKSALKFLCTKKYLAIKHLVRIINTCLYPKLLYLFQIFLPDDQMLSSLDSSVSAILNRFIKLPSNAPKMFWFKVRNLKSILCLAKSRYILTRLNQGLNSNWNPLRVILLESAKLNISVSHSPKIPILLNQVTLKLVQNQFKDNRPPIRFLNPANEVELWTDAHFNPFTNRGAFSIWNSSTSVTGPVNSPKNSTHFELQAIATALEISATIPITTIYTDSLSSIQAINSLQFSEPKDSSSCFPALFKIFYLLLVRKSCNHVINIKHVFAHLLDDNSNSPDNTRKLKLSHELYGSDTLRILEGNRQADLLAKSAALPISDFILDERFCPSFTIATSNYECVPTVTSCLYHRFLDSEYVKWSQKHTRYSIPINTLCKYKCNPFDKLPNKLQNIIHRTSNSLLPTRNRIFNSYHKNHLCPLQNLTLNATPQYHSFKNNCTIFYSSLCNVCNVPANHKHVLKDCLLAEIVDLEVNKILISSKYNLLSTFKKDMEDWWWYRGLVPVDHWFVDNSFEIWKLHVAGTLIKWILHCKFTHSPSSSSSYVDSIPILIKTLSSSNI